MGSVRLGLPSVADPSGELVTQHQFSDKQIRSMVRDHKLGVPISEILQKHSEQPIHDSDIFADSATASIEDENRDLKQLLNDLMLDIAARGDDALDAAATAENRLRISPSAGRHAKVHEPISSLLQRSRIIPAIRGPEYIKAALASPSVIVWLLYGTPLTLPEIVRQVRSAGKLPVANLDLLTGFAQDADGIELLAAEGVAGVVSTRQSALRAARAQGIIAVQRTFIVDSIAVNNIIRALQHFLPDAVELLPAAAAQFCVSTLRTAQPQLPIIATGLVTTMRQVDDLIRCGVSSAATSDVSLWVL
jgi:glycerol uptake operon antiterminator